MASGVLAIRQLTYNSELLPFGEDEKFDKHMEGSMMAFSLAAAIADYR